MQVRFRFTNLLLLLMIEQGMLTWLLFLLLLFLLLTTSPSCRSDQFCDAPLYTGPVAGDQGVCRCKNPDTMINNSTLNTCVRQFCPRGTYGLNCEFFCNPFTVDQMCNDGVFGDGTISCINSTTQYDPISRQCSDITCGNSTNICSSHGLCITDAYVPYCMCDEGFSGNNCELNRTVSVQKEQPGDQVFDECDCSVQWSPISQVSSLQQLSSSLSILAGQSAHPLFDLFVLCLL